MAWASSLFSRATVCCSCLTWLLAWNVLENQPATDRTGARTLLAPSSTGESTSTTPRWTLCSGLFGVSPK